MNDNHNSIYARREILDTFKFLCMAMLQYGNLTDRSSAVHREMGCYTERPCVHNLSFEL